MKTLRLYNSDIEYSRDKRSPVPKSETVSRVMSANRAKNTSPELTLRKRLWSVGHKGYRLHYKKIPGRPDITFISKKVAIFVNGCFWHRCPHCSYSLPKTNTDFWKEKFKRNKRRDEEKERELNKRGWKVLVIWECELKKNIESVINRVRKSLV